jgi:hypothetical protein
MSGFEEDIIREYFEQHGFLVRAMRRIHGVGRRKNSEEAVDLMVVNPAYVESDRRPAFLLFTTELSHIERAMVISSACHGYTRLSPGLLRGSAEILKFIEKNATKEMAAYEEEMASQPAFAGIKRILVLPGLPTTEPYRSDSVALLRQAGVDGIISFRTILQDVIAKLEGALTYEKSPSLQAVRVLKLYDLLKEPQMGLFKDAAG